MYLIFVQIIKGPSGDPGPEGPPVSFNIMLRYLKIYLLYRGRKEILVAKAKMVKMVLPESQEMTALLETQGLKDRPVIKAGMQLSETAVAVPHSMLPKVSRVFLVSQASVADPAGPVAQVLPVNLVGAFLVNLESLEKMVNQVMME